MSTKKKKKTAIINSLPFLLALTIVVLDQFFKHFFVAKLDAGHYINCGLFDLRLVYNTGTAFGLFAGNNNIFVIISLAAIFFIIALTCKTPSGSLFTTSAYMMILAGALGNIIDRIRWGYVIDFIDFRFWPVFNLADAAITSGIIVLLISMLNQKNKHKEGA